MISTIGSMTQDEIMQQIIEFGYEKMKDKNAYPFVAFIVKDGVIISRGYNSKVNLYGDKTTHGEMEAMTKANKALMKKDLVILGKGYQLYSSCEPCLACFDSALWANIDTFVFSVDHHDFPDYFHDHPYNIEDYERDNPGEIVVKRGILRDEGIKLFQEAKQKYGW